MPQVRSAQQAGFGDSNRVALPGAPSYRQQVNTNASDFGGAQAQQLKGLSKATGELADGFQKAQEANVALEATNLSTEMQREALDLQYNPQSGFYAAKGGSALNLRLEAQKKLDALGAKYQEKASNPGAAAAFTKSFETYRASVMEGVMKHEMAQTQTYMTDTAKGRESLNAEKSALQYNDDRAFGAFLKDNTGAVVARASQEGWAPEKFTDELWKSNSKLYHARAYAMLNNPDPNVAIEGAKFYQAAVERGDLTFEDVKSLDAMRDAVYPDALARKAAAEQSGGFTAVGFGAMTPDDIFEKGLIKQESGGRQFDKNGAPLTSTAGAVGVTQVMPETGPDAARMAGLPWEPSLFNAKMTGDPEVDARITDYNLKLGKAYFKNEVARYGDTTLGAIAYNWGRGNLENWMAKVGDPRTGKISMERFVASIPSQEAREYVPNIRKRIGIADGVSAPVDAGAITAKAIELDAQYPGAGAKFTEMLSKQKTAEAALKKSEEDKLVSEGATYMQASNGDSSAVPAALKAKLIQAGRWDEVAKYDGSDNRDVVTELTLMEDEDFARVDLGEYKLSLSASTMEKMAQRKQTLQKGDAGYEVHMKEVNQYWTELGISSDKEKAKFLEKNQAMLFDFKKENKRPPNAAERSLMIRTSRLKVGNGGDRAYNLAPNSDRKIQGINKEVTYTYAGALKAEGFEVNEVNMRTLREEPQKIFGNIPGVPQEKMAPLVMAAAMRGEIPTRESMQKMWEMRNKMMQEAGIPALEAPKEAPTANARGRAWAKSLGLNSEPMTEEEKKYAVGGVKIPDIRIKTKDELKAQGKNLDKMLGL